MTEREKTGGRLPSGRPVLLKDAAILDGDGTFRPGCDILIDEQGFIAEISRAPGDQAAPVSPTGPSPGDTPPPSTGLPPSANPEAGAAPLVVDCRGCVVTPGLVVTHTHAPMVLFRGLAEDISIDDWFNVRIWPYESQLTPDDVYLGARLAAAELISSGVTAFADHYFEAGRIADAVLESGIRADLAPTIFGLGDGVEERIEATAALIAERRGDDPRLTFRMGPHSPYTCPPPVLKAIVDRARELRVGLHLHISETKAQVDASLGSEGRTPFAAVAAAGAFELPLLVGHGLWVDDADLEFLGPDTWFAVSPKTYMKLAMGEGGLWRLGGKLNLATGTDGAASSNTLNPLEQARLWALIGKQTTGRADRFTLAETWRLLMNGHKALRTGAGMVAPGFAADLVVWDLQRVNTAPANDPLAAIIYSAGPANVRDVMVQGRFLKRDHSLVTLDTQVVVAEAARAAREIVARGPGEAQVTY